jgi:hypothetical protein
VIGPVGAVLNVSVVPDSVKSLALTAVPFTKTLNKLGSVNPIGTVNCVSIPFPVPTLTVSLPIKSLL